MNEGRFRKAFLLALVVAISVAFVRMLWPFVTTILMAAVLSGLVYPLYTRLNRLLNGRRPLASALTLLLTLALVIAPLLAILSVVVNQAILVMDGVRPIVERLLNEPTYLYDQIRRLPGVDRIEPYREQILTKTGDIVSAIGGYLVGSVSSTTLGTVAFLFQFFILLYTMFFLLMDGPAMLQAMLRHLPLNEKDKGQMIDRFMSVTRATIKGTIIIGIIQGGLSGLAFGFVGIPNAMFWAVVMMVLSILPALGGALVWVPAVVVLIATGAVLKGIILAAFCGVIVGSVDNVLRPRLVGRDTKMHDLLILFSTLGGILLFGPVGFILGPILAGLFITSWDIFADAYQDLLNDRAATPVEAGTSESETRKS